MIKKSLIIKKKLYKIENKKNLSKLEEEEINEYLTELERIFNKKKILRSWWSWLLWYKRH